MTSTKKTLAVGLTATLVAGAVTGVGAASASAAPATASSTTADDASQTRWDTRDVISFLVLGTGPLIDERPELAQALGIAPQDVPADVVDEIVARFEAVDPDLSTRVVVPVQSGDPSRAQAALEALTADVQLVAEQVRAEGDDPAAAERATARGWTYTINWVATVQVAAAGAYVLAAAAGVVLAVAVVLYSPAGGEREFDRELAAKAVARGL